MWAGGGKKPVEDTVCGRRKRPWLARLHKLINEEQLRVESRIDCTPQVHSSVQNISHADAQEDQSAPSWSGWQLGLQCRQTGGGLNLHLPTHARTHARTWGVVWAPTLCRFVSKSSYQIKLANWDLYKSSPPACFAVQPEHVHPRTHSCAVESKKKRQPFEMKMEQLSELFCFSAPQPLTEVLLLLNLSVLLKVLKSDWITDVLALSDVLALTLHTDSGWPQIFALATAI